MAHEQDDFNRWDAAQTLFTQKIQKLVSAIQNQTPLGVSPLLLQAFKAALKDTTTGAFPISCISKEFVYF